MVDVPKPVVVTADINRSPRPVLDETEVEIGAIPAVVVVAADVHRGPDLGMDIDEMDTGAYVGEFFPGLFARAADESPQIQPFPLSVAMVPNNDVVKNEPTDEIKEEDISFGSSIIDDGEFYVRTVTMIPDVIDISSDDEANI